MTESTYIYSLEYPKGNIKYIGKSNDPKDRLRNHLIDAKNSTITHKLAWLNGLLKKNLIPVLNIIDEVPQEEWSFWEVHYISLYKSWGFELTNSTIGGDGVQSYSPEFRKKISDSLKEAYKNGLEPWNKGVETGGIPWNKDKSWDDKTLNKISEVCKKTFENGRETWNKGLKVSEKERIAQMYRHPNRKDILQFSLEGEFIKEYPSAEAAKRYLGNKSDINRCCTGETKSAGGFLWLRKEDYEKDKNLIIKRVKLFNNREYNNIGIACPYCKIIGNNMGLMKRWHFNNCKHKEV